MLAREHRLRSSDDIRDVVKQGKRVSNQFATIHFIAAQENQFAVVTSKAVGGAVLRNKVRRRTKAFMFEHQDREPRIRAVFRMRPEAGKASWDELTSGLRDLMARVK